MPRNPRLGTAAPVAHKGPADLMTQRARSRLLCDEARVLRERANEVVQRTVVIRARNVTAWLSRFTQPDPQGPTLVQCAWCGRVRGTGGRYWVLSAMCRTELAAQVRVSHGLCPNCKVERWNTRSA